MTTHHVQARKNPTQRRSRETVEAIIEAAARILEAEEPCGFNTNAVARRAGVSIGSLYQYYPGKAALVAELSRRNAETALAGLADAAVRTTGWPLLQRLRVFVRFAIAQQGARPRLARALDQLEETIPLATDARATTPAILALLVPVLAEGGGETDRARLVEAAGDCLALARTLIDRALDSASADAGLEDRVVGTIEGYVRAAGLFPG